MIELLTSLNKGPVLDRLIWRANLSLLNAGPDCIAIVSVDRGPRSLAQSPGTSRQTHPANCRVFLLPCRQRRSMSEQIRHLSRPSPNDRPQADVTAARRLLTVQPLLQLRRTVPSTPGNRAPRWHPGASGCCPATRRDFAPPHAVRPQSRAAAEPGGLCLSMSPRAAIDAC
jgi:hypothetical protein